MGKITTSKQKDCVKKAKATGVRSTCFSRAPYESNLQDMDTDKSYLAWIQFMFQDCDGLARSIYYKYQGVRYSVSTIEVPNLGLEIWDSQIWNFFNGKSHKLGTSIVKALDIAFVQNMHNC